ncbi:MAG TPA: adenosylhomocysteinase [Nitrososphaera sp.]|nr:adenosylhomocysteinase [Nitrososphaera sp.]
MPGRISDPKLAEKGRLSYQWASERMAIIERIATKYRRAQPLAGLRLGVCLHITKETSVLVTAAKSLGARIAICSANPLSAQDDIAAFLYSEGIRVYAWRGETRSQYDQCIRDVIRFKPDIVTDDGGDLHSAAHRGDADGIVGGSEETTSGVRRLEALDRAGRLAYPVIAVNNARTKHLFDNRYGTGQSTLDGILRATSIFLAGKRVVVCGYGWVGKGIASRARGMGCIVTVTEVNPTRALEARMDGFEVLTLGEAASSGDIFITCTGQIGVIRKEHFTKMKDGAILANAGHFDVEIDKNYLYSEGGRSEVIRPNVERLRIGGKKLYLLSKGRVVNLVAAEGNPPEVMALSFANQLLCILHVTKNHARMEVKVHPVPDKIDLEVARYALDSMGIKIDKLTKEQRRYLQSSS